MPLQATSGAASYDAFGGGVPAVPNYIEECFSAFLYTGNDSTQTITNGIDLSTKGGMVWIKARNTGSTFNCLFDTARGATKALFSNATNAQGTYADTLTSFNTTGFTLGADTTTNFVNAPTGQTEVSWTFRKQPKFFDVVTFVKDSSTNQRISHSLDSVPGCIIVKRVTSADDWYVYHRSLGGLNKWISLNSTGAVSTTAGAWGSSAPTDTDFGVSTNLLYDGGGTPLTYVAYVFAHDAGGFGLTGTDNVISCGSAADGNSLVTLGYEPQWVLIKGSQGSSGVGDNWLIADAMRGMVYSGNTPYLAANLSSAEDFSGGGGSWIKPTATGFQLSNLSGTGPFIYIAIRRGPMKVPTSGTSVFAPVQYTSATTPPTVTTGFPVDMIIDTIKGPANENRQITDRLRGSNINLYRLLYTNATDAESSSTFTNAGYDLASNTSTRDGFFGTVYGAGYNCITWNFRRAPSFFDEVCYTGTGSARTVTHNLGVAPEMMIVKERSGTGDWWVYNKSLGSGSPQTKALYLSFTDAESTVGVWNNTAPTSSVFSVSSSSAANGSGLTYVAYLFATCAGVSKVGSYTGTATTKQIDCGFTGGARFVLIKRTDSTGSWYVWDSSRGIVSGNDPYLLLNSTAAEVTNTDYIDTYSAGFEISSTAPAEINASGGSFIFLAIS